VVKTGKHGRYYWLVAPTQLWTVRDRLLEFHQGLRLCITSFDSGPLTPTVEERDLGWTRSGEIAVSPPISKSLDVPHDGYDEWYVFEAVPDPDWKPEVFVNFGRFTIVPVEELLRDFDPTWERDAFDWLRTAQDRFWKQLEEANPVSFIASGDLDVVVSQREQFIHGLMADMKS
jgi:hypothetical protein